MLRVGLTGGIGSGKSTVANIFRDTFSIDVIDADIIAHELTQAEKPAVKDIVERFGDDVLQNNGQLDRKKLRQRVFENPEERSKLEAILHPQIRAEIDSQTNDVHSKYCIIAIPLLIESGMQDLVDRILVVDCAEEHQIARASQRDGNKRIDVEKIVAAQLPRQERLSYAHDIIDNSGNIAALEQKVSDLHKLYQSLDRPT